MANISVINRFLQGVATRNTCLATRHFCGISAKIINNPTELSRQLNREIVKPKFASLSQQSLQRKFSKKVKMVRRRHLLKVNIKLSFYGLQSKLSEQEREELLKPVLSSGWSMVEGRDAIYKEFLFKDFNEAFGFMTRAGIFCDKIDHHPEWYKLNIPYFNVM
jgi:Pterin 4 alpha carbinolamine dehydratase